MRAVRDIKAGEELVHDYCGGCTDEEERKKRLASWGINEE